MSEYTTEIPEGHKRCNRCDKIKLLTDFHKHSGVKIGRHPTCRTCRSQIAKERRRSGIVIHEQLATMKSYSKTHGVLFDFTADDYWKMIQYWGGKCAVCGTVTTPPYCDHWISIQREQCTGSIPQNIVPLCSSCNNSKGNKDAEEWVIYKVGIARAENILSDVQEYFEKVARKSQ